MFANKARIDNRKNLLDSNISPTCAHNMVNFWRLFGAPKQISTGFASWLRYCTAFEQWAPAKLCCIEQRVPAIFGRAAITLGIGPHSSCYLFTVSNSGLLSATKRVSTTPSQPRPLRHVTHTFLNSLVVLIIVMIIRIIMSASLQFEIYFPYACMPTSKHQNY